MQGNQNSAMSEQMLKALLQSREGQKLVQLLNQDGGNMLRQAAAAAQAGNYQQALQKLQSVISTPEASKLLTDLKKRHG